VVSSRNIWACLMLTLVPPVIYVLGDQKMNVNTIFVLSSVDLTLFCIIKYDFLFITHALFSSGLSWA